MIRLKTRLDLPDMVDQLLFSRWWMQKVIMQKPGVSESKIARVEFERIGKYVAVEIRP
jgi:hypothetical protein